MSQDFAWKIYSVFRVDNNLTFPYFSGLGKISYLSGIFGLIEFSFGYKIICKLQVSLFNLLKVMISLTQFRFNFQNSKDCSPILLYCHSHTHVHPVHMLVCIFYANPWISCIQTCKAGKWRDVRVVNIESIIYLYQNSLPFTDPS